MTTSELMTRRDVAAYLQIHHKTVSAYVRRGALPAPVRLGAGTIRWRRQDIDAWVERQAAGDGADESAV